MQFVGNDEHENNKNVTLESVSHLAKTMAGEMEDAIKKIQDINEETHVLALNAAIEASSAGDAGKGFGVVAEHMGSLSNETSKITKQMSEESQKKIFELDEILSKQATNVRGNRLANLALTNISLIDRNLYERTADVRWWATERSIVDALNAKTQEAYQHAAKRLSIILKYYSIYHDLILCDIEGNVVANANPQFKLTGINISKRPWFQSGLNTSNGDEFGFESVHRSRPINNQIIVTFSCKVHQNGDTKQPAIGILGTVFDWTRLAQKIVKGTPIEKKDQARTRVCIVDQTGSVLADSDENILEEQIPTSALSNLYSDNKNFFMGKFENKDCIIGHATSPGFEGYASGWHSIIIQEMQKQIQ